MPRKKLGLIYTSSTLIDVFNQLCQELIPEVEVLNITDDSLIKGLRRGQALFPVFKRQLCAAYSCI